MRSLRPPTPHPRQALRTAIVVLGAVALGTWSPLQAADPSPTAEPTTSSAPAWRALFDGRTSAGWRGFRAAAFPDRGWKIEDGILKKVAGVRGGDLVSEDTFEEFEFSWEWRIPRGANNGVKYFILEERGSAIGHEYQMIDDSKADSPKHRTGSFYDVLPPRADGPKPRVEAWNTSRIVVQGQRVEHWLNGELILEYQLSSPAVLEAVSRSKFKGVDRFGTRVRGRLLLTDHGDEAWFRNLKVRDLSTPETPQAPAPAPR